jgi:hypothetical protein
LYYFLVVILTIFYYSYHLPGVIVGALASVFLSLSFLAFLNITESFKKDSNDTCSDYYCDNLVGNEEDIKWDPGNTTFLLLSPFPPFPLSP